MIDRCIKIGQIIIFDQVCTKDWQGETIAIKKFYINQTTNFK